MDTLAAAKRWREAWLRSWPTQDVATIASLYTDDATYRSHPFREPEEGGALGYVTRAFSEEREGTTCWFGAPIIDGDRAAIEYWSRLKDLEGATFTLAGVSVLRFRDDGMIVNHLDYWVMDPAITEPPPGWGGSASQH